MINIAADIFRVSVPAFMLGILLGPFAGKIIDVSKWGGEGIQLSTHEIAFVCLFDAVRYAMGLDRLTLVGSDSPRHRNPASQSRLRASKAVSETTGEGDDDMPVASHGCHVALHYSVHQAAGAKDYFRTSTHVPHPTVA
jgi:hypothetical protein